MTHAANLDSHGAGNVLKQVKERCAELGQLGHKLDVIKMLHLGQQINHPLPLACLGSLGKHGVSANGVLGTQLGRPESGRCQHESECDKYLRCRLVGVLEDLGIA